MQGKTSKPKVTIMPTPETAPKRDALRILCVHGVGHQEKDPAFEKVCATSIHLRLAEWSQARPLELQFHYGLRDIPRRCGSAANRIVISDELKHRADAPDSTRQGRK